MGFEPHRVAVAGALAGDVEHVLDREGQAAQRAFGRAGKLDVGVAAKGVVGIGARSLRTVQGRGLPRHRLAAALERVEHRGELGDRCFRACGFEDHEVADLPTASP